MKNKIGYLRREVDLTNTIINMIKHEQVYDIKDNMLANNNDKLLGSDEEIS